MYNGELGGFTIGPADKPPIVPVVFVVPMRGCAVDVAVVWLDIIIAAGVPAEEGYWSFFICEVVPTTPVTPGINPTRLLLN